MGLRSFLENAFGPDASSGTEPRIEHGWYPLDALDEHELADPRVVAALKAEIIGYAVYPDYKGDNPSALAFAEQFDRRGGQRPLRVIYDSGGQGAAGETGRTIKKTDLPLPILERACDDGFVSAQDLAAASEGMGPGQSADIGNLESAAVRYGAIDSQLTEELAERALPTLAAVDTPHWHADETEVPHSPAPSAQPAVENDLGH